MRKILIFVLFAVTVTCWAQENSQWKGLSSFPKTTMKQIVAKTITVKGSEHKGAFIKGRVVVLDAFKMGIYPVTQQLYKAVMLAENDIFNDMPSKFKENAEADENQDLRPVEHICWYDAVFFCNKLSELEGLEPVYNIEIFSTKNNHICEANVQLKQNWHKLNGYRLPTEAEWEFAARGGNQRDKVNWAYIHSGGNEPNEVMWFFRNSDEKTHEVGLKKPNSLGLFDMCGNVKQWCFDAFDHITQGRISNPTGADSSPCYVLRGGSWSDNAQYCTVIRRENDKPFKLNKYYGFRLVQSGK